MVYFLCRRISYPDLSRLCSATGWIMVNKVGGRFCCGNKRVSFSDNDIAIRWGGMFSVPIKTINTPEATSLAAHKLRSRKKLIEEGVPTPKTWFDIKEAVPPFIARPSTHSGGRDFFVIHESRNIGKSGWYFSELIEPKQEYRVYVGSNKVIGAYRKTFKEGEVRANRRVTGLLWGALIDVSDDIKKVSIDACAALGLETGAVDVIVGENPMVIEVNTTPTISNKNTMSMYIDYFKSLL